MIANPEKCFRELISENLLILLRDGPCQEFSIASSNFEASLFRQEKLLESVCSKKVLKFTTPALFRINSVIISARTSLVKCLSCRMPYQSLHRLNALPSFSEKALLFTDFCFFASNDPILERWLQLKQISPGTALRPEKITHINFAFGI